MFGFGFLYLKELFLWRRAADFSRSPDLELVLNTLG
jgi:hypothetical protein